MAKLEYKYNPKTLRYEKIARNSSYWIKKGSTFSISGIIFGIVIYVIAYIAFPSLKEHHLMIENAQLKKEYEILNNRLGLVDEVLLDIQERDDNLYRTVYGANAISENVRKGGIGGADRYGKYEGYENSKLVSTTVEKLDQISKSLVVQSKSFDELLNLAKNKSKMMASIPAIQPLRNKDLRRISSGYGSRIHPILKIRRAHMGVDFVAPIGTEIYATGDGKVSKVKDLKRRGYGKHIIIDHGYGYQTVYGHLIRFNVKKGQRVHRGDVIGYLGSTGLSTAPHLHYEVRKKNKYMNPAYYFHNDLNEEEFEQIIEISSRATQSFD